MEVGDLYWLYSKIVRFYRYVSAKQCCTVLEVRGKNCNTSRFKYEKKETLFSRWLADCVSNVGFAALDDGLIGLLPARGDT